MLTKLKGEEPKALTPRQKQIISLIVNRALGNKEIAATLGIRKSTVNNTIHHILLRTGCKNRVQLALKFHQEYTLPR